MNPQNNDPNNLDLSNNVPAPQPNDLANAAQPEPLNPVVPQTFEPTQPVVNPAPQPVVNPSPQPTPAEPMMSPTITPNQPVSAPEPLNLAGQNNPVNSAVTSAASQPNFGSNGPSNMPPVGNIPPVGGGTYKVQEPKKSKAKLIITIIGVIALLSGVSAVAFYFLYWTRSDVVYSRFQKNMTKVISSTLKSDTKLFNNVSYAIGETPSQSNNLGVSLAGRALDSGTDNSADLSYNNAKLNIALTTVNNSDQSLGIYLKYNGITKFYNSLAANNNNAETTSTIKPYLPALQTYNNKWLYLDLPKLVGDSSANTDDNLKQSDIKTLVDKFNPIISTKYFGTNKSDGAIKTSNIKSDSVNGQGAWSYEITTDTVKFNAMIDDMDKAVDSTDLTANKKKYVKDFLDAEKIMPVDPNLDAVNSKTTTTYKIWIDKLSGYPVKFSSSSTTSIQNKTTSTYELAVTLTKFSTNEISAKLDYKSSETDGLGKTTSSTQSGTLSFNNLASNIKVDYKYTPDTSNSGDNYSANFKLEPTQNKSPVAKPASYVSIDALFKELENINSSNNANSNL